jgi:hypothetical protein
LLATTDTDAVLAAAKAAGVEAAVIGSFKGADITLGASKVSLTQVKQAFEAGIPDIAT